MSAADPDERRLTLPNGHTRRGAPVLVVGFDDQAASLAALRTAADLARRLGADLHVVHGIDVRDYPVDSDADVDAWESYARKALEHLHAQVRETLTAHRGRGPTTHGTATRCGCS